MDDLVCTRRNDVFLYQHFYAVGDRLKKTEWADPVRPVAILHSPQNFTLEYRDKREEREKDGKQRDNVDQAGRELNYPIRRAGNPGKQPSFSVHEDLIESQTHPREEKRGRVV